MNLERLKWFLAIVDAGTMAAAAKRVYRTQPALSRSLQQLEDEIGAALFVRKGRSLVLTSAGRMLESRARELLQRTSAIALEVQRAAERGYDDLRLGTVDSVAAFIVPYLLAPLRARFPRLAIRLVTARTVVLLERLRSAQLDLAIVAHSGPPKALTSTHLGAYRLRYYGRKDLYPKLSRVRSKEELGAFPIVELEPASGLSLLSTDSSRSHGFASNVATVKALVMEGFGVGDLPAFVLSRQERRRLNEAPVAHDADCGLYLARSPGWCNPTETAIEETLATKARQVLGASPRSLVGK